MGSFLLSVLENISYVFYNYYSPPFSAFLPSGIPIKHAGPPQFILSILSHFLLPLLVFCWLCPAVSGLVSHLAHFHFSCVSSAAKFIR